MNDQLFRCFGHVRTRLDSGRDVFQNRITHVLSVADRRVTAAAGFCSEFATLSEHAGFIAAQQRNGPSSAADWKLVLLQAAEAGLLTSIEETRAYILSRVPPLPCVRVISRVGIPTKNRPQLLRRALKSVVENLQAFEREAQILVTDDSESLEMQAANRQAISSVARSNRIEILYGNLESRRRFTAFLARESGLPIELISFALANDQRYPVGIGACRNSLLLDSAGHCLLYLDDDVRLRVTAIPGSGDELVLRSEPFSTWFLSSADEIDSFQFPRIDLLGAHESLLNFDRDAVRDGRAGVWRIALSSASIGFLKRIPNGNAGVVVSVMGVVGDSGFDDPLAYFVFGGETFGRLINTKESYESALFNRLVLHGPKTASVAETSECHSYCMGVDNTEVLPPFFPMMRGEELVFGTLITKAVPGALFGAIPKAILHEPGEARQFASDAAVRRAARFMTGETLAFLIGSEDLKGTVRGKLMKSIGVRLREALDQDDRSLNAQITSSIEPMLLHWLRRLDEATRECTDSSAFWARDVLTIKAAILSGLEARNHLIPIDLEQAYGADEGALRFRRLGRQFGLLLEAWPDIVGAAKAVQSSGHFIHSPVTKS